ncbi:hypothetical protein ACPA0F_18355 [Solibacillus silvestris]
MKVTCTFCGAKFGSPSKGSTECPSCGSTDQKDFIFAEDVTPEQPESQMMYEVKYKVNYGTFIKEEHEEVTEKRLNYLQTGGSNHYSDLEVLKQLGMSNTELIPTWYEIGMKNPWIAGAYDPAFSIKSFVECKRYETLVRVLKQGNWSTGTAFYYRNLAFINQVDGGDEWMIIKDDVDFESYSCGAVLRRENGIEKFSRDIWRYLNTPKEQLRGFNYVEAPDVIEIEGIIY